MRRRIELAVLLASIAFGAFLRFRLLGDVSFWLDELAVDMTDQALRYPWWRWVIGFDPEHGSLYHLSLLFGRLFFQTPELAARFAGALAGVAAIPVAWLAARTLDAALVAPILIAVAPLHVYYSREARPYALLMLLAISLTAAMLMRARVAVFALLVVATLYTSASGAPLLIACAIAALVASGSSGSSVPRVPRERRRFVGYAIVSAAATALIPFLYRGERYESIRGHFDGLTHTLARNVLESLSVVALDTAAHHRAALLFLALALAGAFAALRRDRVNGTVVVTMAFLPLLVAIAALRQIDHWYATRYISPALPGYLLVVAEGVAFLAAYARRARVAVALACALALAWQCLPGATEEPLRKLNWRAVARSIWSHAKYGDWVIATSAWAGRCLGFYLRELPPRVRVVGSAPELLEKFEGVWVVSAGAPDPPWACRLPVVLTDPFESLRVHYAPSLAHFLTTRSSAAERHALALTAARGDRFAVGFGPDDDPFLVRGWEPAGPPIAGDFHFRWVIGTRADVFVPFDTAHDRRVTMHVLPFADVPQTVVVSLNDGPLAAFRLTPGWHDYTFDTHAAQWRSGRPNILTFAFDKATRSAADPRPLSAAFHELRFDDATPSPRAYVVRLDGVPPTPLPQRRRVTAEKIAPLLASLGAVDRPVEPIAYSLVDAAGCLDDAAFVHLARSAILDARDRGGDRYFIDFLHQGGTRTGVIDLLIDELNRRADIFGPSATHPPEPGDEVLYSPPQ